MIIFLKNENADMRLELLQYLNKNNLQKCDKKNLILNTFLALSDKNQEVRNQAEIMSFYLISELGEPELQHYVREKNQAFQESFKKLSLKFSKSDYKKVERSNISDFSKIKHDTASDQNIMNRSMSFN
jgi:hypothetical protein